MRSEYFNAGSIVGQCITNHAAAVSPSHVFVWAELMFGDETGFFHIAEHNVRERRVGREWCIQAYLSQSFDGVGPEADGKFFE
jgi:hypothetical protein